MLQVGAKYRVLIDFVGINRASSGNLHTPLQTFTVRFLTHIEAQAQSVFMLDRDFHIFTHLLHILLTYIF